MLTPFCLMNVDRPQSWARVGILQLRWTSEAMGRPHLYVARALSANPLAWCGAASVSHGPPVGVYRVPPWWRPVRHRQLEDMQCGWARGRSSGGRRVAGVGVCVGHESFGKRGLNGSA
jgi:hypothetical protein